MRQLVNTMKLKLTNHSIKGIFLLAGLMLFSYDGKAQSITGTDKDIYVINNNRSNINVGLRLQSNPFQRAWVVGVNRNSTQILRWGFAHSSYNLAPLGETKMYLHEHDGLHVKGRVRAHEVKVDTGWSDFVFYDDYKLPTLEEVEQHIEEKGHLKDIPSAKEVEENGIELGKMDSKLLQKIEELTLYLIDQNKRLKDQNKRLKELEQENSILKKKAVNTKM